MEYTTTTKYTGAFPNELKRILKIEQFIKLYVKYLQALLIRQSRNTVGIFLDLSKAFDSNN